MATFTLKMDCDNEAFQPVPLYEIGGILRYLGDKLLRGEAEDKGTLRDVYGNVVGEYCFEKGE